MIKRIAISSGEPAGIGPELMYHLVNFKADCQLVIIGSKKLLKERMAIFNQDIEIVDFDPSLRVKSATNTLCVLDVPLNVPSIPGVMDVKNSTYVLKTLDLANDLCMNKTFDALVTGPISKGIIEELGIKFTGHTEYLQQKTNTKEVVMMLGCKTLNVALVTTHLPLKDVSAAITKEKLTDIITILNHDLKTKMGVKQPKIYICGLNPHAGENGHLGREEIETIIPVITNLQKQGMDLIGPLPADTIFSPQNIKNADAFLTMYHDQGLPVLKYIGFDSGYNTTLGLPYIRTSVDHGTALNLAGTGKADAGSLISAVNLALYMANI